MLIISSATVLARWNAPVIHIVTFCTVESVLMEYARVYFLLSRPVCE
jgi:hypothetical protein